MNGVLWHDNLTNTDSLSATLQMSNVHSGDPSFAADGYHISAGSAAVDKGQPVGVAVDIDGELRVGAPDLGADELEEGYRIYLPLVIKMN